MVQAERSFTMDRGFLDVHVQAERAAVDLRCPDIYQVMNRLLDRGVPEGHAELDKFLEQLGGLLLVVDALGHIESSMVDKAL